MTKYFVLSTNNFIQGSVYIHNIAYMVDIQYNNI